MAFEVFDDVAFYWFLLAVLVIFVVPMTKSFLSVALIGNEPNWTRGLTSCKAKCAVVDARARGTGLGRALVRSLVELAAERGAATATLNCAEANEAFYRKCGFSRARDGAVCWSVYLRPEASPSDASLAERSG